MRVLDLFAGIGGFSLAAHWMGWKTVAFCEQNRKCQERLRLRFGHDKPIYDDIKTFPTKLFKRRADIITAGFPCQPFSHAGKRAGKDDDRYLWHEVVRVISETKPAWFCGENVAGIATMVFERGGIEVESRRLTRTADSDDYFSVLTRQESLQLERCCSDLESEGYEVQPLIIPACGVNAPHRRDRVWIIANDPLARDRRLAVQQRSQGSETDAHIDGQVERASRATQHTKHDGLSAGEVVRGNESTNGKQSPRANSAANVKRADRSDTHTSSRRSKSSLSNFGQGEGSLLERPDADGIHKALSDAQGVGLQGGVESLCQERSQPADQQLYGRDRIVAGWDENWFEAASRLCRVDDGLPDRVDRLKQLGNSVVPVEVYEIFLAIDAAENEHGREIET